MANQLQFSRICEPTPGLFGEQKELGALPLQMHASDATARELVATGSGTFGADLLRFPAGGSVPMHSHSGDHILVVVSGTGEVLTPNSSLELTPGAIYLVPEYELHEIRAKSELVLVAVGNDRKPPDGTDRLVLAESMSKAH